MGRVMFSWKNMAHRSRDTVADQHRSGLTPDRRGIPTGPTRASKTFAWHWYTLGRYGVSGSWLAVAFSECPLRESTVPRIAGWKQSSRRPWSSGMPLWPTSSKRQTRTATSQNGSAKLITNNINIWFNVIHKIMMITYINNYLLIKPFTTLIKVLTV